MPESLQVLNCAYNNLTELPKLPNILEFVFINNNPIKFITLDNFTIIKRIYIHEYINKMCEGYHINIDQTMFYDNSGYSSQQEFFGVGIGIGIGIGNDM